MSGVLQDPYMLLGAPNRLHQTQFLFSLQGSYPTILNRTVRESRRLRCFSRSLLGAPNRPPSAGCGASKLACREQRHEP